MGARPVAVRRPWPLLAAVALVAAAVAGLSSCTRAVRPPVEVRDPALVRIVEYGRHASLVLPAPDGMLVEWSWGDWNYFALGRTGLRWGAQALFWSESATLARRSYADPRDDELLRARLGATDLVVAPVERVRAEALLAELEARYDRNRATEIWNARAERHFVRDDAGRYWLFNTSAHELSRWLGALDVEVRGAGPVGSFAPAPGSTAFVPGTAGHVAAPGTAPR